MEDYFLIVSVEYGDPEEESDEGNWQMIRKQRTSPPTKDSDLHSEELASKCVTREILLLLFESKILGLLWDTLVH